MNKLFENHYYEESNIYSNNELWKQIQKDPSFDSNTMKRKDFNIWLSKQEDVQIQKVHYKPPLRLAHPIIAKPNSYQTDLMFLKEFHSLNNGFDSIINFVEVTTKKAFAYPLKSKTASAVYDAFEEFYKEINGEIAFLEIDKGSEFSKVISFCNSKDIQVIIYNADKNSMSIVERFNRTLRSYISKNCKDGVWFKLLPKLIIAYNKKIHSSLFGLSPNFVSQNPSTQDEIRQMLIGRAIDAKLELKKFKIGDKVRFFKKRSLFGKGGGEYSDSIHTITSIFKNSIFLDGNDKTKYRYYNLLKVGEVQNVRNKPIENETRTKAKNNYKVALKLVGELDQKMSVKEADKYLQRVTNDDTVGRGKRIKKPNQLFV